MKTRVFATAWHSYFTFITNLK